MNSIIIQSSSRHQWATFKNTKILFVCPPKFCINVVSIFSWDSQWSQEKIKTMLMQNFGGQTKSIMVFLLCKQRVLWYFYYANKEYYGIFESGLYHHHNYHSFYLIPFADQHYQLLATFSFVPSNFHAFGNIHCHNLLDELAN